MLDEATPPPQDQAICGFLRQLCTQWAMSLCLFLSEFRLNCEHVEL